MTKAYAAIEAGAPLIPFSFNRRDLRSTDVEIDLLYCGLCHTDIHMVDNDWGFSIYPMVPGHEMVGRVIRIGNEVTKFRIGDNAAIGCFIDSCRTCEACQEGMEQYCENRPTGSACFKDSKTGQTIFGGFSTNYVVDAHFALKLPNALNLAGAAPLLCAGITTYSPLRHWKIGPESRVGVAGIGGLGHLAVKFARAMGAHVVSLTSSAGKIEDALRLGSHEAGLSDDRAFMARHSASLDLILDTISANHDVDGLIGLLRREGTLCLLGAPSKPTAFAAMGLGSRRRNISASQVGGIAETQEMLDFCGEHGVEADVEVLPISQVNRAFDRLKRNDVKYRFVLDLQDA